METWGPTLVPRVSGPTDEADAGNKYVTKRIDNKNHSVLEIEENSKGYGYEKIFNKFLMEGNVTEVEVQDAFIMEPHQIDNFLRFCEVVIKSPSEVTRITLFTKSKDTEQKESLVRLKQNLAEHKVILKVIYDKNSHDRRIRFSNGWIVVIDQGLDYFQELPWENRVGSHEYDLRQCKKTTVDAHNEFEEVQLTDL